MEVEDALKAILLDIEGYLGIRVDPRSYFIKDLRRYLTQVRVAGYVEGDDDGWERGQP